MWALKSDALDSQCTATQSTSWITLNKILEVCKFEFIPLLKGDNLKTSWDIINEQSICDELSA